MATVSLALVLFLDAVQLRFDELGQDWRTPMLALGPGTLLTIALVAGAALLLLNVSTTEALLLGAILSSTDPVVLRDIVRDQRVPRSVRRTLSVEAGTNDLVILPTVLVLIAVRQHDAGGMLDWLAFLAKLLLIGPLAGVAVGAVGAWLMSEADRRYQIRNEYQALYGIGLVLAAYFAGVTVGGDGFLAAFAAGVAVTVFNFELCACFLEYGEVTAEMLMLFAFILFGAALAQVFDLVAWACARLRRAGDRVGASTLHRTGPASRDDEQPGACVRRLVRSTRASVALARAVGRFGRRARRRTSIGPHRRGRLGLGRDPRRLRNTADGLYGRRFQATLAEEREARPARSFSTTWGRAPAPRPRWTHSAQRLRGEHPPMLLDVRTRSQYDSAGARIPGSLRVMPDQVADWAAPGVDRERSVV